jgi:hypothetical protein
MESLKGGKFWGSETKCETRYEFSYGGVDYCVTSCIKKSYFFWIVTSIDDGGSTRGVCP